jgi:adenosylcobyric acid synthase
MNSATLDSDTTRLINKDSGGADWRRTNPALSRLLPPTPGGVLIAGTTSDAGKSFVATGLCRLLVRQGWAVRPFKAVNMSLNSVPTPGGEEIALAQWVQCRAARCEPSTLSNPVLLKPRGRGVEVVVRGVARCHLASWRREMAGHLPGLRKEVRAAIDELREIKGFVVAEGAGSPVEVNLRSSDLSNFFVAEALDVPVILVADLERGGALAQVVGTWELLRPGERCRLKGIVFNRIRGDPAIFKPACRWVEDRVGIPVLGVLPCLPPEAGFLPPEDSLSLPRTGRSRSRIRRAGRHRPRPRLGLLRLPHTSNFSDFSSLERASEIDTFWVEDPGEATSLDAILLPGSHRARDDLAWMRRRGWSSVIAQERKRGLGVGGICGGYQMLGTVLDDPLGFEGRPGRSRGLGLLPIRTQFHDPKIVRLVSVRPLPGHPWAPGRVPLSCYEIHRGRSEPVGKVLPLFSVCPAGNRDLKEELEGSRSADEHVWGTVLHGVLDSRDAVRDVRAWVVAIDRTRRRAAVPELPSPLRGRPEEGTFPGLDQTIDRVAELLDQHLDRIVLGEILGRKITPLRA